MVRLSEFTCAFNTLEGQQKKKISDSFLFSKTKKRTKRKPQSNFSQNVLLFDCCV